MLTTQNEVMVSLQSYMQFSFYVHNMQKKQRKLDTLVLYYICLGNLKKENLIPSP